MKRFTISVFLLIGMVIIGAAPAVFSYLIFTPNEVDITTIHPLPFLPENYSYENETSFYPGSFILERSIKAYQKQNGRGPHFLFLEADFEKELFHFYDFSQGNPVIHASLPIETPKVRILNLVTVGNYRVASSEISTEGRLITKRHFFLESGLMFLSLIIGLIGAFLFWSFVINRILADKREPDNDW